MAKWKSPTAGFVCKNDPGPTALRACFESKASTSRDLGEVVCVEKAVVARTVEKLSDANLPRVRKSIHSRSGLADVKGQQET